MNYYKEILDSFFYLETVDWQLLRKTTEFFKCIGAPENQKWHANETTDIHINKVFTRLKNKWNSCPLIWGHDFDELTDNEKIVLYLATFFHDFKKPECITRDEKGIVHQYNHEKLGSRYLWDFAYKAYGKLSEDQFKILLLTSKLIYWHMEKGSDFLTSKRAKYLLSSFTSDELKLLAIFNSCDQSREDYSLEGRYNELLAAKEKTVNYYSPFYPGIPNLIVTIGASGSGKSTWAQAQDTTYVSTDEFRQLLTGDINNQDENDRVFNECRKVIRETLEGGETVIFDATNTTFKNRASIVEIGHKLNIPVCAQVFLTPLEQCIENQNLRDRKVPVDVIKRQYERIELPSYCEFNLVKYHY